MSNYLDSLYNKISPERKRRFEYADRISQYLRSKLSEKGLSQKEFAKKMDMPPPQLNRYMNGEANLNLETIAKLEIALQDRIIMVREPLTTVKQKVEYSTQSKNDITTLYSLRHKEKQTILKAGYIEKDFSKIG